MSKMKNDKTGRLIKKNIQRLINLKIIKNEKELNDPALDTLEKISNELDICIKDILCCYCPFENCINECKKKI